LIGAKLQEGDLMLVESVMPGEVWLTTYLVTWVPLCLTLAYFLERSSIRLWCLATACLATLCLLLTFSRAGLLALVCEAAALAWFVRRRAVLIGMAVSVLIVVLGSAALFHYDATVRDIGKTRGAGAVPLANTRTLEHRFETWKFVVQRLADHGMVGIGYGKGSLKLAYERQSQEGQAPANLGTHNTFLEIAISVGLPGLVLFLWLLRRIVAFVVAGFRRTDDPMEKAILLGAAVGVIGLLVRLMFDHMLIGTLALQFWVLVALAMVVYTGTSGRGQAANASR
jgi:O-antigen ligase